MGQGTRNIVTGLQRRTSVQEQDRLMMVNPATGEPMYVEKSELQNAIRMGLVSVFRSISDSYTKTEVDGLVTAGIRDIQPTTVDDGIAGIKFPTQSGTYANYGNLTVDISEGLNMIFSDGSGGFTKSVVPIELGGYATLEGIEKKVDKTDANFRFTYLEQSAAISDVNKKEGGFYISDEEGNVVFKASQEGVNYIKKVQREEFEEIKGLPGNTDIKSQEPNRFLITDENGNVVFEASQEGVNFFGKSDLKNHVSAFFDSNIAQIIVYGQSLSVAGAGSGTIEMYNTKMFAGGILTNYNPDDETAKNAYYLGGIVDMPSTGVESGKIIGRIVGQLIQSKQGIEKESQDYELLINAPGVGGINYDGLASSTNIYYRRLIESVEKGFEFAVSNGKSYSVPALVWVQGENSNDKNKDSATVVSELTTLFSALNTDIKAITGQERDVQFLTYQVASFVANSASVNMPLGHLQLAETVDNVHFATAMYQYPYADNLHLNSVGYRRMYATIGAQVYQAVNLRIKRNPILPKSYKLQQSGSIFLLIVKMEVPVMPLVFDTEHVAAQPNYGLSIKNGVTEIITGVSLKNGDTLNITCNENPTGLNLEYCITGAAAPGNIRDSQGDQIKVPYDSVIYRVDNWAPIFRKVITI